MAPARSTYQSRRAARRIHDHQRHPRSDNQRIALRALSQPQHRASILHLFAPFSASRLQVDTFFGLQDIHSHVVDLAKLVTDYCDTIEMEVLRNEATCHQRFMALPVYSTIASWARDTIPNDARVFPTILGPLCAECGRQGHMQTLCPQYFCLRCNSAAPGHRNGECGTINPVEEIGDVPPLTPNNEEWPNAEAAAQQWPSRPPTPFPVRPPPSPQVQSPASPTPSSASDEGIQRGHPSWARANGRQSHTIPTLSLLGEEAIQIIMQALQTSREEIADEPVELQYPRASSSSSSSV